MAIMEYADAHPNHVLNATTFQDGRGHSLVASEFMPDVAFLEMDANDAYIWCHAPNGWERVREYNGWVCRKNNRYIYITG